MKELLRQYRELKAEQEALNSLILRHPEVNYTTTIEQVLKVTEKKMVIEAIEIAEALQKELANVEKGLDPPEQLGKPLWAVVPANLPDDIVRRVNSFGSISYRLFFTKEKAIAYSVHELNSKVIPVWGE